MTSFQWGVLIIIAITFVVTYIILVKKHKKEIALHKKLAEAKKQRRESYMGSSKSFSSQSEYRKLYGSSSPSSRSNISSSSSNHTSHSDGLTNALLLDTLIDDSPPRRSESSFNSNDTNYSSFSSSSSSSSCSSSSSSCSSSSD